MQKNTIYGKLEDNKITYAPMHFSEEGIFNPLPETYYSHGWKSLHLDYPTDSAGENKHWEEDGYDETDTDITKKWKIIDDPAVPRKFSKLKIYGAIVSLPDSNGTSAWDKIKMWLENKTINGVNGWMAFQLAQEISEDHPLFATLSEEAREILGLTIEQFETLLAQCILEGSYA